MKTGVPEGNPWGTERCEANKVILQLEDFLTTKSVKIPEVKYNIDLNLKEIDLTDYRTHYGLKWGQGGTNS